MTVMAGTSVSQGNIDAHKAIADELKMLKFDETIKAMEESLKLKGSV